MIYLLLSAIRASDDTIDVTLVYRSNMLNFGCATNFGVKLQGELTNMENRISSACSLSWDVVNMSTATAGSSNVIFLHLILFLQFRTDLF